MRKPRRRTPNGFWLWFLITLSALGSVILLCFIGAGGRLLGI